MRCLITGGAGFIGSHLAVEALKRGYETVVLDDLSTGKLENLSGMGSGLKFIQGDIRDRELVADCAQGVDLVFHHAAEASVPRTVEDPVRSAEINDLGTLNVFLAARDQGVRRVVFAGSSAVYGSINEPPHVETMTPDLLSPYAAHKLLGEHYAAMFYGLYGFEIVSLRYFNVFGPRQDPSSPYSGVISIFMDRMRRGIPPTVYGDGGQSRDFIYVGDVVAANFMAAEKEGLAGKVFNVGTGRSVTLNRMLEILADLSGSPAHPVYEPARAGDVYASRAEVSLAAEVLGFTAGTSFEKGLGITWDWFRDQK